MVSNYTITDGTISVSMRSPFGVLAKGSKTKVMVELNGIEHARPGALRAPSASLRGVGLFQLK